MNDAPGDGFNRWSELDALFTRALELAPDEREAFLGSACADDPELRRELDRVLAAHVAAENFLENPDSWLGAPEALPETATFDVERVRPALADRYAIEREVGSGGMAFVLLAKDLKHRRPVAIKVLRLDDFVLKGSDRFLREIEIAANLHHPHILPLYDSGEADGLLFYVMPYVEGESLHDRLAREGQLPVDEAVHIAREVADALSYAHGRGVVHRDIKPANIMLESGHALVADFGVAKAIDAVADDQVTKAGVVVGTPAYMSPEHASGAQELDGRSDIYSLGCVLYEMLAGERPYAGTSLEALFDGQGKPPPSIRAVRDAVPEQIDEVVSCALATEPADRFATAGQLRDALGGRAAVPSSRTPVEGRRRRRRATWMVAVVAVVLISAGFFVWSRPAVPFDERDWVVVVDFENRTGDSVFDRSLYAALTTGLQQSRFANVFPRTRVTETLRRMQREDVERIDVDLGREVAIRENLRLVVVPSIDAIDSTYVLTTRITDPASGGDVKSRSERARGKADVLPAVERLVRGLRRDLGEARFALTDPRDWFWPVTTSSLEALRAWTDGSRQWRAQRHDEALTLFQRAVALDSNFAQAHQALGGAYYFTSVNRPLGDYHFDKALSLVDSLSQRERLWIRGTIASWREDREIAIRDYGLLVDRYPDFEAAWFNLGNNYMRLRRHEEAIRAFGRVLELDSASANALINTATSFSASGVIDSALVYYRKAFELQPEWVVVRNLNHEFGFAYAKRGDYQGAEEVFSRMLSMSPNQQAHGYRSLGLLRMLQGQYEAAVDHLGRAVAITGSLDLRLRNYRDILYRAAVHRVREATASFERDLSAATEIADRSYISPPWLQYLARFRAERGERSEVARLLDSMTAGADSTNRLDRAAVLLVRGELARLEGERSEAQESFERARVLMDDAYNARSLAENHAAAGRIDDAIEAYRRAVDTGSRSIGWEGQEPWVWAHYRLARLYESVADTSAALEYYRRLLEIWENADEDLPALIDARERVRELTADRG